MNQRLRFRHHRFDPGLRCPCARTEELHWCAGTIPDDGVPVPGTCVICWHCARVMIADSEGQLRLQSEGDAREQLRDTDLNTRLQFEAWLEAAKKHIGLGPNEEAPTPP